MSKVNDLIKKLCPNGVIYKSVGEVCNVYTGGETPTDIIKDKVPRDDYIYPIYSNGIGDNALYGYAKTYRIDEDAVTFSSIGTLGHPEIRKGKFTPIIRLKDSSQLYIRYLKYALETAEFDNNKSSLPNLNANMLKNITIPIPPLEVQEEIVRILDKYEELENGLEEELDLRKKQYSFYLNKLLRNKGNVKIADVFKRVKGTPITAGKMKEISNEKGEIKIFAGGQTVVNANIDDIPNANICKNPCVIVQSRGIIDFIYYDKPFTFKNEMWAYTCDNKITVKYLYYYLKNNVDYFRTIGTQMGSMPQISLPVTEKFEIDLPSIDEQRHIVNILDKFKELENELEEELDLRKKQYEYYRNKLLNFEEMNANV